MQSQRFKLLVSVLSHLPWASVLHLKDTDLCWALCGVEVGSEVIYSVILVVWTNRAWKCQAVSRAGAVAGCSSVAVRPQDVLLKPSLGVFFELWNCEHK